MHSDQERLLLVFDCPAAKRLQFVVFSIVCLALFGKLTRIHTFIAFFASLTLRQKLPPHHASARKGQVCPNPGQ